MGLRLLLACLGLGMLASCTNAPEPPPPTVSTQEFERRLDEHLARIRAEVLPDDVRIGEPVRSREAECDGGPDWGVVPRLVTEIAGDQGQEMFLSLHAWLPRNGFGELITTSAQSEGKAYDIDVGYSTGEDGTEVRLESLERESTLAIVLTGPCTWPPERAGGPAPDRLPPLAPPGGQLESTGESTCESPKVHVYNNSAPPYSGPGPHPITIIELHNEKNLSLPETELPERWRPTVEERVGSGEPTNAQLIVCVRAVDGADSGRRITCHYDVTSPFPVEFTMLHSTYHFVVREALTNRQVGEFSLRGTDADPADCPLSIEVGRGHRSLLLAVAERALHDRLRPFAEGAR